MLHRPIAPSDDACHEAEPPLIALIEPGGADLCVSEEARLSDAVAIFREHQHLQFLGVVDAERRPVGLMLEQDVRAILYNPFGHALMANPTFNRTITKYIRECPVVDSATPIANLFEQQGAADAIDGMIVVEEGRFAGLLSNRTLVRIAADREAAMQRARAERAERGAAIGRDFMIEVDLISAALDRAARRIDGASQDTVGRIGAFQHQTATIASACQQTDDTMTSLAEQGALLATTIQRLRDDTLAAQAAAGQAVELADADGQRSAALEQSTRAIDGSLDQIRKVAREAHVLSINAAIEAARLGQDAGGLSVIAREMRQFAANTRLASASIEGRIEEIRAIAGEFTAGHALVSEVVRRVDGVARAVDTAMGTEAETARLYADNVGQAKLSAQEIMVSVTRVSGLVDHLAGDAAGLRGMAQAIGGDASALRASVDGFVGRLRTVS